MTMNTVSAECRPSRQGRQACGPHFHQTAEVEQVQCEKRVQVGEGQHRRIRMGGKHAIHASIRNAGASIDFQSEAE